MIFGVIALKNTIYFPRFAFGGSIYCLLEFLWRGRSHVSMFLAGGAAFLVLCRIGRLRQPLWLRALLGAAAVTAIEFVTGLIVNRALGLAVWDYSALRFHLLGQISLLFSAIWIPISLAAFALGALIDRVCLTESLRRGHRLRGGR